jgi:hypothetical protein
VILASSAPLILRLSPLNFIPGSVPVCTVNLVAHICDFSGYSAEGLPLPKPGSALALASGGSGGAQGGKTGVLQGEDLELGSTGRGCGATNCSGECD